MRPTRVISIAAATALAAGLAGQPAAAQGQLADYLIGVWNCPSRDVAGQPAISQMVLLRNGRFTELTRSQSGFVMRKVGFWRVGQGYVRFSITNYEPKYFYGPLGRRFIRMPTGETVRIRPLNRNRLQTQHGYCQRSA